MGNFFGSTFRIFTFGESHGPALGVVIEGCPAGVSLNLEEIQQAVDRRRPGQSALTTSRKETDQVECLSGLDREVTLGSPLAFIVKNHDVRPDDYQAMRDVFRPSHADLTTYLKYGVRASSGGGRASARETVARVIAGAVAEQCLLSVLPSYRAVAWVESVGTIVCPPIEQTPTRQEVDRHATRCPDPYASAVMAEAILSAKQAGDSLGGTIRCHAAGVCPGLGEPVFDKLDAELAKAMLSIPSVKAFEIGSGFLGCQMTGSQHNDPFVIKDGRVGTLTNHSGGVQGGISNGEVISFRVGFKPVSTIGKEQASVTLSQQPTTFHPGQGRHDPCVLPRAVPIVEAMVHLTLFDFYQRQRLSRLP